MNKKLKIKFNTDLELEEWQIEDLENQIKENVEKNGYSVEDIETYTFSIPVVVKLKQPKVGTDCKEKCDFNVKGKCTQPNVALEICLKD